MKRAQSVKTGKKVRSKKKDAGAKKPQKRRALDAHRVNSDLDFETLIREEFKKLQRQYRLMEDAHHKIIGVEGKLSKQVHLFKWYRDDRENLLTDLKNAGCARYKEKDKQTIRTILEIMEVYEFKKSLLRKAMLDITEMEENVDKITKRLIEQKIKVQKVYGLALPRVKLDKLREKLENRLYYITTKFDTKLTENKALHDDISAMLQIRGKFFRRVMAIRRVTGGIKQKMGGVVFEATQAYEQRDDWTMKTVSLREKNDKDSKQHVLEIKELQRILHHDSKLHEFMGTKNRERLLLESLKERNFRKNRGKVDILNETLYNYKSSFKSILKMGRTGDLESLVSHYLSQEQENYAIFKFVTDMNHELCVLKGDMDRIKMEIEEQYTIRDALTSKQSKDLENMESTLKEEKRKYEELFKAWKAGDKHMEEFGTLLESAFSIAECQNDSIIALLGNSQGMRPHNICLCLSALEHRISHLLFEKGRLEVQNAVELDHLQLPKKPQIWLPGVKPKPCGGPFKPKVMVTGRMDAEQDEEEQDDKQFSRKPFYYPDLVGVMKARIHSASLPSSSIKNLESEFESTYSLSTTDITAEHKKGINTSTTHPSVRNV